MFCRLHFTESISKNAVRHLVFMVAISTMIVSSADNCASLWTPSFTETGINIYNYDAEIVGNKSVLYTCDHCKPQCAGKETTFWCLRVQSSEANGYVIDDEAKATWNLPNETLTNLNSTPSDPFCFCVQNVGFTNCSSFPKTYGGTFKCVITYSSMMGSSDATVTETLLFTHSVYTTSDDTKQTQMPTSSFVTSMLSIFSSTSSSTILLGQTTTTPLLTISSLCSSTVTEQQVSSTTPLLTISSSCSSTVASEQVSTTPYYAGIGLLVATNLITIILLISSCVYISSQRKKSKL